MRKQSGRMILQRVAMKERGEKDNRQEVRKWRETERIRR
jgi:hypothetical protein